MASAAAPSLGASLRAAAASPPGRAVARALALPGVGTAVAVATGSLTFLALAFPLGGGLAARLGLAGHAAAWTVAWIAAWSATAAFLLVRVTLVGPIAVFAIPYALFTSLAFVLWDVAADVWAYGFDAIPGPVAASLLWSPAPGVLSTLRDAAFVAAGGQIPWTRAAVHLSGFLLSMTVASHSYDDRQDRLRRDLSSTAPLWLLFLGGGAAVAIAELATPAGGVLRLVLFFLGIRAAARAHTSLGSIPPRLTAPLRRLASLARAPFARTPGGPVPGGPRARGGRQPAPAAALPPPPDEVVVPERPAPALDEVPPAFLKGRQRRMLLDAVTGRIDLPGAAGPEAAPPPQAPAHAADDFIAPRWERDGDPGLDAGAFPSLFDELDPHAAPVPPPVPSQVVPQIVKYLPQVASQLNHHLLDLMLTDLASLDAGRVAELASHDHLSRSLVLSWQAKGHDIPGVMADLQDAAQDLPAPASPRPPLPAAAGAPPAEGLRLASTGPDATVPGPSDEVGPPSPDPLDPFAPAAAFDPWPSPDGQPRDGGDAGWDDDSPLAPQAPLDPLPQSRGWDPDDADPWPPPPPGGLPGDDDALAAALSGLDGPPTDAPEPEHATPPPPPPPPPPTWARLDLTPSLPGPPAMPTFLTPAPAGQDPRTPPAADPLAQMRGRPGPTPVVPRHPSPAAAGAPGPSHPSDLTDLQILERAPPVEPAELAERMADIVHLKETTLEAVAQDFVARVNGVAYDDGPIDALVVLIARYMKSAGVKGTLPRLGMLFALIDAAAHVTAPERDFARRRLALLAVPGYREHMEGEIDQLVARAHDGLAVDVQPEVGAGYLSYLARLASAFEGPCPTEGAVRGALWGRHLVVEQALAAKPRPLADSLRADDDAKTQGVTSLIMSRVDAATRADLEFFGEAARFYSVLGSRVAQEAVAAGIEYDDHDLSTLQRDVVAGGHAILATIAGRSDAIRRDLARLMQRDADPVDYLIGVSGRRGTALYGDVMRRRREGLPPRSARVMRVELEAQLQAAREGAARAEARLSELTSARRGQEWELGSADPFEAVSRRCADLRQSSVDEMRSQRFPLLQDVKLGPSGSVRAFLYEWGTRGAHRLLLMPHYGHGLFWDVDRSSRGVCLVARDAPWQRFDLGAAVASLAGDLSRLGVDDVKVLMFDGRVGPESAELLSARLGERDAFDADTAGQMRPNAFRGVIVTREDLVAGGPSLTARSGLSHHLGDSLRREAAE